MRKGAAAIHSGWAIALFITNRPSFAPSAHRSCRCFTSPVPSLTWHCRRRLMGSGDKEFSSQVRDSCAATPRASLPLPPSAEGDDLSEVLRQAAEDEGQATGSPSEDEMKMGPCATSPLHTQHSHEQSEKELKKLRKKELKAARRAKREGGALTLKPCDLCGRDRDLLIRCRVDDTLEWHMVCGRCWKEVSGGVVDGDAAHPHYQYGGLWKARG